MEEDYFMPSEVARLILGYLVEKKLNRTFKTFVNECPDLAEYWQFLKQGKVACTTIMGQSLREILNEFAVLKLNAVRAGRATVCGQNSSSVESTRPKSTDVEAGKQAGEKHKTRQKRHNALRRKGANPKPLRPEGDVRGAPRGRPLTARHVDVQAGLPSAADATTSESYISATVVGGASAHDGATPISSSELNQTLEKPLSPQESATTNISSVGKGVDTTISENEAIKSHPRKCSKSQSRKSSNDSFENLDRLLDDTQFAERLAEHINKARQASFASGHDGKDCDGGELVAGPSSGATAQIHTEKPEHAARDPVDINQVIEMTEHDPTFQSFLQLFQHGSAIPITLGDIPVLQVSAELADNQPNSAELADNQPHSAEMADNQPHSAEMADNQPHSAELTDNQPHSAELPDNQPHSAEMADNQPHSPSFINGSGKDQRGGTVDISQNGNNFSSVQSETGKGRSLTVASEAPILHQAVHSSAVPLSKEENFYCPFPDENSLTVFSYIEKKAAEMTGEIFVHRSQRQSGTKEISEAVFSSGLSEPKQTAGLRQSGEADSLINDTDGSKGPPLALSQDKEEQVAGAEVMETQESLDDINEHEININDQCEFQNTRHMKNTVENVRNGALDGSCSNGTVSAGNAHKKDTDNLQTVHQANESSSDISARNDRKSEQLKVFPRCDNENKNELDNLDLVEKSDCLSKNNVSHKNNIHLKGRVTQQLGASPHHVCNKKIPVSEYKAMLREADSRSPGSSPQPSTSEHVARPNSCTILSDYSGMETDPVDQAEAMRLKRNMEAIDACLASSLMELASRHSVDSSSRAYVQVIKTEPLDVVHDSDTKCDSVSGNVEEDERQAAVSSSIDVGTNGSSCCASDREAMLNSDNQKNNVNLPVEEICSTKGNSVTTQIKRCHHRQKENLVSKAASPLPKEEDNTVIGNASENSSSIISLGNKEFETPAKSLKQGDSEAHACQDLGFSSQEIDTSVPRDVEPAATSIKVPSKFPETLSLKPSSSVNELRSPEVKQTYNIGQCLTLSSPPYNAFKPVDINSPQQLMGQYVLPKSCSLPAKPSFQDGISLKTKRQSYQSAFKSVSSHHSSLRSPLDNPAGSQADKTKRTVIAVNSEHPPFIPDHCKKNPTRRIKPLEVSYSTPSPLQDFPSSPMSFVTDLPEPNSPAVPVKESSRYSAGVKSMFSPDHGKLKVSRSRCSSIDQHEDVSLPKSHTSGTTGKIPASPAMSTNQSTSPTIKLPPSPSRRKPKRIKPVQLSSIVKKGGTAVARPVSSVNQPRNSPVIDDARVVSSTSDLTTESQSEAAAFRMLKSIASSYSKPQPRQEISSTNQTKYISKCGCLSRNTCKHRKGGKKVSSPKKSVSQWESTGCDKNLKLKYKEMIKNCDEPDSGQVVSSSDHKFQQISQGSMKNITKVDWSAPNDGNMTQVKEMSKKSHIRNRPDRTSPESGDSNDSFMVVGTMEFSPTKNISQSKDTSERDTSRQLCMRKNASKKSLDIKRVTDCKTQNRKHNENDSGKILKTRLHARQIPESNNSFDRIHENNGMISDHLPASAVGLSNSKTTDENVFPQNTLCLNSAVDEQIECQVMQQTLSSSKTKELSRFENSEFAESSHKSQENGTLKHHSSSSQQNSAPPVTAARDSGSSILQTRDGTSKQLSSQNANDIILSTDRCATASREFNQIVTCTASHHDKDNSCCKCYNSTDESHLQTSDSDQKSLSSMHKSVETNPACLPEKDRKSNPVSSSGVISSCAQPTTTTASLNFTTDTSCVAFPCHKDGVAPGPFAALFSTPASTSISSVKLRVSSTKNVLNDLGSACSSEKHSVPNCSAVLGSQARSNASQSEISNIDSSRPKSPGNMSLLRQAIVSCEISSHMSNLTSVSQPPEGAREMVPSVSTVLLQSEISPAPAESGPTGSVQCLPASSPANLTDADSCAKKEDQPRSQTRCRLNSSGSLPQLLPRLSISAEQKISPDVISLSDHPRILPKETAVPGTNQSAIAVPSTVRSNVTTSSIDLPVETASGSVPLKCSVQITNTPSGPIIVFAPGAQGLYQQLLSEVQSPTTPASHQLQFLSVNSSSDKCGSQPNVSTGSKFQSDPSAKAQPLGRRTQKKKKKKISNLDKRMGNANSHDASLDLQNKSGLIDWISTEQTMSGSAGVSRKRKRKLLDGNQMMMKLPKHLHEDVAGTGQGRILLPSKIASKQKTADRKRKSFSELRQELLTRSTDVRRKPVLVRDEKGRFVSPKTASLRASGDFQSSRGQQVKEDLKPTLGTHKSNKTKSKAEDADSYSQGCINSKSSDRTLCEINTADVAEATVKGLACENPRGTVEINENESSDEGKAHIVSEAKKLSDTNFDNDIKNSETVNENTLTAQINDKSESRSLSIKPQCGDSENKMIAIQGKIVKIVEDMSNGENIRKGSLTSISPPPDITSENTDPEEESRFGVRETAAAASFLEKSMEEEQNHAGSCVIHDSASTSYSLSPQKSTLPLKKRFSCDFFMIGVNDASELSDDSLPSTNEDSNGETVSLSQTAGPPPDSSKTITPICDTVSANPPEIDSANISPSNHVSSQGSVGKTKIDRLMKKLYKQKKSL